MATDFINWVWFLQTDWVYMSLISAAIAAFVDLIASTITAVRIGQGKAAIYIAVAAITTFISCLLATLLLSISVHFAYLSINKEIKETYIYWGIGFAVLNIIIKSFVPRFVV